MVLGDCGQNLSVNFVVLCLKDVDELAVGCAEISNGGIDADVPETAVVVLLVLAVSKSVGSGVGEGFLGLLLFLRTSKVISFSTRKDIAAALQ